MIAFLPRQQEIPAYGTTALGVMWKKDHLQTMAQAVNSVKRTIQLIAASVVLSSCVSTTPQVTTGFYSISGTTSEDLDRQLRTQGPLSGHAIAVAEIQLTAASVRQVQTAAGCVFANADFRVKAKITLPRWKERRQTKDKTLGRAWDNIARYAKAHEDTHVKIANVYAKQLGEAIEALPPAKTCAALDKEAEKIVKNISRAHNRAQNAFDAAEQKRLRAIFGAGS